MTAQQENYLKDQIEKLAKNALGLLGAIDSTALFVEDNGGFGQPLANPPVETTLTPAQQTAYNALLQIRAVLNGWDVTTGVYRAPLNQVMNSPQ